jgi:hypothetical protein
MTDDIYYLDNGRKCALVEKIPSGYVVRKIVGSQSWEGELEEFFGETIVVEKVYKEAPQEVYAAEIEERVNRLEALTVKIQESSKQLRNLHAAMARSQKEAIDQLERLRKHDAFKRLEDFLAGKITHIVTKETYESAKVRHVSWLDDVESSFGRHRKVGVKLVSLFGRSNGDLEWRVNDYMDGSGSWATFMPFASEAEAVEYAKSCVAKELAECNGIPYERVLKAAAELSVEIPVHITEAMETYRKEKIQKEIDDLDTRRADAVKRLNEVPS